MVLVVEAWRIERAQIYVPLGWVYFVFGRARELEVLLGYCLQECVVAAFLLQALVLPGNFHYFSINSNTKYILNNF